MKKLVKTILILAVGFVAGAAAAGFMSYQGGMRLLAHFYMTGLIEQATDIHQLQGGRAEAVLERKRRALPGNTEEFVTRYGGLVSKQAYKETLWSVSRVYESPDVEAPDSIKPILDALPPRPLTSCERRAKKEAETEDPPEEPAEEAPSEQTPQEDAPDS